MAHNLINKYVWLVETIYNAGRITYEEINEKWLDNEMSEGVDLALRTFHKWRIAAEEMFGLLIECERRGGYHYYIANAEELKNGNMRNWLLSTLSVSNLLIDNQHMKERILLEEIPSGQEFLAPIITAMKECTPLVVTYRSFWRGEENTFEMEPYCVKLFKQRWYVVGHSPYYTDGRVLTYALDRIVDMHALPDRRYSMPDRFDAEDFFSNYFGVSTEKGVACERVRLRVSPGQANYLRTLPMHHTQQEVQSTSEYSIFEMRLCPTNDFVQEILWHGECVEVLEPLWLRTAIAEKINAMSSNYGV
ncbi:MAG: WYL domain-containing protein [Coprobacter sp.]|nr:WYL domain-containing protein [Coprobacter sp.]